MCVVDDKLVKWSEEMVVREQEADQVCFQA